jgi:hypothetical protein
MRRSGTWTVVISASILLTLLSLSLEANHPVDKKKKVEPQGERKIYTTFVPTPFQPVDYSPSKFRLADYRIQSGRSITPETPEDHAKMAANPMFRPVEVELTGDLERAQELHYYGVGSLNMLRLENIFQLPVYRKVVHLDKPKGTITCSTVFGKEMIQIHIPPQAMGVKRVRVEEQILTNILPAFEMANAQGEVVGYVICHSGNWGGGYEFIPAPAEALDPFEYGQWMAYHPTRRYGISPIYESQPFDDPIEDQQKLLYLDDDCTITEIASSGYHNQAWMHFEVSLNSTTDSGWVPLECIFDPPDAVYPEYRGAKHTITNGESIYYRPIMSEVGKDNPLYQPYTTYDESMDPVDPETGVIYEPREAVTVQGIPASRRTTRTWSDGWVYGSYSRPWDSYIQAGATCGESTISQRTAAYDPTWTSVQDLGNFAILYYSVGYDQDRQTQTLTQQPLPSSYDIIQKLACGEIDINEGWPSVTTSSSFEHLTGFGPYHMLNVNGVDIQLSPSPEGEAYYHYLFSDFPGGLFMPAGGPGAFDSEDLARRGTSTSFLGAYVRYFKTGKQTYVLASMFTKNPAEVPAYVTHPISNPVIRYVIAKVKEDGSYVADASVAFPAEMVETDWEHYDTKNQRHQIPKLETYRGEPMYCYGKFRLVMETSRQSTTVEE